MTNGDKIRQMTDEEIIEWWRRTYICGGCPIYDWHREDPRHQHLNCSEALRQWLRQEVKDE